MVVVNVKEAIRDLPSWRFPHCGCIHRLSVVANGLCCSHPCDAIHGDSSDPTFCQPDLVWSTLREPLILGTTFIFSLSTTAGKSIDSRYTWVFVTRCPDDYRLVLSPPAGSDTLVSWRFTTLFIPSTSPVFRIISRSDFLSRC